MLTPKEIKTVNEKVEALRPLIVEAASGIHIVKIPDCEHYWNVGQCVYCRKLKSEVTQ